MFKSMALQIILNSIICDIVFQAESEEAQRQFCGPARPRLLSNKLKQDNSTQKDTVQMGLLLLTDKYRFEK